ncbi:MAG: hypothetical protein ACW97Z_16105 [Candidatus Hodarchaeales archaeon]|jgi:hypothetical protein
MNISELVFTSFGPILYNLIFLFLWVSWIDYHYKGEQSKVRKYLERYFRETNLFYLVTGVLIFTFLFLLLTYANANTDVDDAITSGVEAFLTGDNPYQEDVVIHHLPTGITYGRYHYFPPDLIVYSGFYLISAGLFAFLGTYWFVPLHLLFLVSGYWFLIKIVDWPNSKLIPFYLLLVTPFLFTNSMLMWFFFIIGYYFYEIKGRHNLGMVFYVFAASVKYLVGFIIIFYLYQAIQAILSEKNKNDRRSLIIQELNPFIIGSLALAIVSIPFNIFDVIISVFLYQGDIAARGEVAQLVGPLLIEILQFLALESLYVPIIIAILAISIIILRSHTTYEKIIHISFLAMFILPFYGTELFITLPFFWWFKEGLHSYSHD